MKLHVVGAAVALALYALAPLARADAVFNFAPIVVGAPDSRNFANSGPTGGTLATGTMSGILPGPTYNFLDTWNFTLGPDANAGGFVGSFNFLAANGAVTQGIDNLQLRLVGPAGPSSATLVGWQSGSVFPEFEQRISLIPTTMLLAGNYQLQVRGLLVGPAYSYAGTFQTTPVPVPPALPLMAAGLLVLATLSKRRLREA